MRIKHWAGYGCVNARKVNDNNPFTLHIRVEGDHERGLRRDDDYDLFNWLVKRFDKSVTDYVDWHRRNPKISIIEWTDEAEPGVKDACDYYFTY